MSDVTLIPPRNTFTTLSVVAYCRVSTTDESQEDSLSFQATHWEGVVNEHPDWEFKGIYAEQESGTHAETRPELMRLLADCRDGRINMVLTKSVSRFSRNTVDCLSLVRTLRTLRVSIIFEKEKIDTGSMTSELFLSIMGVVRYRGKSLHLPQRQAGLHAPVPRGRIHV